MRIGVRQSLLRDRCWMLDARCWIFRNALIVKSKNIQYPGTSIQNQPVLAMVFVVTTDIEYMILCNYRVNIFDARFLNHAFGKSEEWTASHGCPANINLSLNLSHVAPKFYIEKNLWCRKPLIVAPYRHIACNCC